MTQEAAESGLSKRAARVLSRLRNPEDESGCVRRDKLGISTSGADVKVVVKELADAGFTVTSGRIGYRLVGWDPPQKVNHCGERPAEPPVTVKMKSAVIGPRTSPDCDSTDPYSSEVPKSEVQPAGGPTEPPAARDDDTAAPSQPGPPQAHGTVPFAGRRMDWELWAIARCIDHIECLPGAARARVAAYVASRYL